MKNIYIVFFLLFSSFTYSQSPCPGLDSLNYSGQWYHTVQIGTQCWLKENLNVGTMVPAVKDQINNDTIEKFCYNNDSNNCNIYCGLYQWREAMQYTLKEKSRGICPIGWHVPQYSEFTTLFTSVNNNGNALKTIGQGNGTNTSGFSAMLGGENQFTLFYNIGASGNFWSSTNAYTEKFGFLRSTATTLWTDAGINASPFNGVYGLSVRCIKDNDSLILQSPYGGESWEVGSVHSISWGGSSLNSEKIKIEYTTDNGGSWIIIIDSTPAQDGSYLWTVPNNPSKNCKVRITDIDNSAATNISDAVFSISTPCPQSFEYGGQIYNLIKVGDHCWFKENLNVGVMIPGIQNPDSGVIEKYCYNDDTANCTVYGGLYRGDFCPPFWHKGIISDLSKDVLYDGNALKAVGQGSGFGAGNNISGFSLLLSGIRESNGTFQELGQKAYFSFGLLHVGISFAYILFDNSSNIGYSEAYPTSEASSVRCMREDSGQLTMKTPNGGENWQIGTTQKISWTFSNVINIRIDYTTNNGTSWINITPSYPTSQGSYSWIIPNTPSTNCKVKITSTNSSDTNSISNIFSIYQVPTNPCPGVPTVNYSGQAYNTIAIGDQCWLRENLNIGTMINVTIDQSNNGVLEKYCYNNDTNNCSIYGGLYQWNEAMQYNTTERTNGICPIGWHIPTWNEFATLKTFVGNNGNGLKEVGQGSGTNTSGFSALLAGGSYQGAFMSLGSVAVYWSSTEVGTTSSNNFQLPATGNNIFGSPIDKIGGMNIRCINDSSVSALPVELTSFTASVINNNVKLNWNTATEINFSFFEIQKKSINNNNWQIIASVNASGNSNSPKQYSYIEKNVYSGQYNYRLKMMDLNGFFNYSKIVSAEIALPLKFELGNAYPNPWNPTSTIRYQVPLNILVSIKVYDALGKEVSTLVNEVKPAGNYEVTLNGKGLSSGIYYYQMKAGSFLETKKFVLIK